MTTKPIPEKGKSEWLEQEFLTGKFLIAMPALSDPNFFHSVTFICEHNAEGALGLVINRQTAVTIGEVLTQMGLDWPQQQIADQRVFHGGPVEPERGFVIHQPLGHWDATININEKLGVTSSKDIIEALSKGSGPDRVLMVLGYAGWGPGQLEEEMASNFWLSGPADPEIIFSLPDDQRWEAAAKHMGVDLALISNDVGHA